MPGDPWRDRCDRAMRAHPNLLSIDQDAARNYDTLGHILRDVLRVDATPANTSSPGRRRGIDDDGTARSRLRSLLGDDYSTLPFRDTFAALAGSLSRTDLADRTGISRTQVHRLLTGMAPTTTELEQVAEAFGKRPWFFAEYRTTMVLSVFFEHLSSSPETSMHWARELGLVS